MGADQVTYHGRFRDEKGRYEEIRDTLINEFLGIGLRAEEYYRPEGSNDWEFVKDNPERWKSLFKVENGYMQLYISNCFGNWGRALEYIEKKFIRQYSDVLVEFAVVEYYDGVNAEGIVYDGKQVTHELPSFVEIVYDDYEEDYEEDYDEDYDEFDDDCCYKFEFDSVDSITLRDSVFVLTGFSAIEENKIGDIIVSGGGEIKSSTVLATNYLIVKEDYDHQTKKYDRAIELKEKGKNISIISDKLFYELVEENSVNKENSREDILDSPAIKECIFGIAKELSKINETLSLLINEIEKKRV